MSYYSSDFVEQLRSKSDLVSLISEDTVLKGHGDRFMGLCPFPDHNEKTASFSVSASQGLYHCFGCKSSGNIFTYLQKQRGMDFKSAVEYLAYKLGMEIPKSNFLKKKQKSQLDYYELTEKICCFFEQNLKQTPPNHPVNLYLKQRAWSKDMIQSFRLGYATQKNTLYSFLNSMLERKKARELGLLSESTQRQTYFDTFRNRLIFPILSERKKVVGFGARILKKALPKYINSRDSKIFQKGNIFYGLNESARYLRQTSTALVVEGYTDFLSLWDSGFKNTVATLGTALTKNHAFLLKKYVSTVILVFDGDEAGLRASERSLPLLLKVGLKVNFLSLPEGEDPDDFIKLNGIEAFRKKINSVQDMFLFILKQKHLQTKDTLSLLDDFSFLLAQVQDESLLVVYKQRLLGLFGTDGIQLESSLNQKIHKAKKASFFPFQKTLKNTSSRKSISLSKAIMEERLLLILCLESEMFLKRFLEKEGISYLKTKEGVEIFKILVDRYKKKEESFNELIHFIINKVSEEQYLFKASYPILKESDLQTKEQIFQDCLNSLKKKRKYLEASHLLTDIKIQSGENLHDLEKLFQLTKQRLKQKKNI
ncbi:MAG: DNA primase [Bdellovibrionales bacterium]|nr:DNA primase [Bdellovibrionales bacterium]